MCLNLLCLKLEQNFSVGQTYLQMVTDAKNLLKNVKFSKLNLLKKGSAD
jgi:hypothetical protein